jgi:Flp pilus assembly protein TadG
MRNQKMRDQRGANLVEFAAVLVFGLPLLIVLVFVGNDCAHFYIIKSAMEVGARNAARGLVVQYNKTGVQNTSIDWLTTPSFIANKNQFSVSWDPSTPPAYVTVTCAYPSGGGDGLPVFPTGPLRYLSSNSTFSPGTIHVQGTFTLPVQ